MKCKGEKSFHLFHISFPCCFFKCKIAWYLICRLKGNYPEEPVARDNSNPRKRGRWGNFILNFTILVGMILSKELPELITERNLTYGVRPPSPSSFSSKSILLSSSISLVFQNISWGIPISSMEKEWDMVLGFLDRKSDCHGEVELGSWLFLSWSFFKFVEQFFLYSVRYKILDQAWEKLYKKRWTEQCNSRTPDWHQLYCEKHLNEYV